MSERPQKRCASRHHPFDAARSHGRRLSQSIGVPPPGWLLLALVVGGATEFGVVPDALAQTVSEESAVNRPRVRIQRSLRGDPLLDEAIVRTLGELGAVDLDVEVLHRAADVGDDVGPLEGNTYGLLTFDRQGDVLRVRAWGPDGQRPMTQMMDTSDREVTAEVIAVRAVEALRAKWLQHAELSGANLPDIILEFARARSQPPPVERVPAAQPTPPESKPEAPAKPTAPVRPPERSPVPEPPQPDVPTTAPSSDDAAIVLQLTLGPNLTLEAPNATHYGLGGSLLLGLHSVFLGASVDGSLTRAGVTAPAGSARVRRDRYLGVLRGELALSSVSRGSLQLGVGVARYAIDAEAGADPELEARNRFHDALCGVMRLGFSVWPLPALGIYADGEIGVLARGLVLRMDGEAVETLGSPAAALGVGVILRYPTGR